MAYLNSPAWRARRQKKLQDSGWRCEQCNAKRHLQVHHRTYDRLGAELDEDLEVLCADCHEGRHIDQMVESEQAVYLKLASQALRARPFESIGELTEQAKRLCVTHGVHYDGPSLHRALGLLTGTRIPRLARSVKAHGERSDPRVVGPQEAHEILSRLGVGSAIRAMPRSEQTLVEQQVHEKRVREQAALFRGYSRQDYGTQREKRRPVRARLEEIFARASA